MSHDGMRYAAINHDQLNHEIELLDLPPRIYNALKRNRHLQFLTIRDLVHTDLKAAHNIGPVAKKVIDDAVASYLRKMNCS